jgi:NAD(P)-dependent dehydrogenase (short-subunit alcohol dehydrogenase family)
MNILFTIELAERLKDTEISVNALHPGVVGTNLGNELSGFFNILYRLGKLFMISHEKGSVTSLYLASSEEVKYVTGKYFVRCNTVKLKNHF